MDGENKGTPYEQMDDLGGFPIFLETPRCASSYNMHRRRMKS